MSANSTGTVLAVCLSPNGGIPKYPQPQVTVGPHGVEGDYHAGPGSRQVSVVAKEVFDALDQELGIDIPPGGFGENVLVDGLGDLSTLKAGDVLHFSSGVELEVSGQNDPCRNLMTWHPQVPKLVYGKRGIVAVVRTPGFLRPGDTVEVIP